MEKELEDFKLFSKDKQQWIINMYSWIVKTEYNDLRKVSLKDFNKIKEYNIMYLEEIKKIYGKNG